jgi:hypothetical protein
VSILGHDAKTHAEDCSPLAAPVDIFPMWHGAFNECYWFFAAVEVEHPGIGGEALFIFGVLRKTLALDELALAGGFGGLFGRGLCRNFLGWRLGRGLLVGVFLATLASLMVEDFFGPVVGREDGMNLKGREL